MSGFSHLEMGGTEHSYLEWQIKSNFLRCLKTFSAGEEGFINVYLT